MLFVPLEFLDAHSGQHMLLAVSEEAGRHGRGGGDF